MKLVTTALAFLMLPLAAAAQNADHDCPYMMSQAHPMDHNAAPASGLSDEQRSGYLKGEGMGFAKSAELNHYPGPRHVLDNAEKLQLSPDQLAQTQALGRQVVAKEDELDSLFRGQHADVEKVKSLTAEIALLQGELRALHLSMHLRERALLSADQVAKYDLLRNYTPGSNPAPMHQH